MIELSLTDRVLTVLPPKSALQASQHEGERQAAWITAAQRPLTWALAWAGVDVAAVDLETEIERVACAARIRFDHSCCEIQRAWRRRCRAHCERGYSPQANVRSSSLVAASCTSTADADAGLRRDPRGESSGNEAPVHDFLSGKGLADRFLPPEEVNYMSPKRTGSRGTSPRPASLSTGTAQAGVMALLADRTSSAREHRTRSTLRPVHQTQTSPREPDPERDIMRPTAFALLSKRRNGSSPLLLRAKCVESHRLDARH